MKRNPNRKSFAELFQISYNKYKSIIENEDSGTYEFVDFLYKKAKNGRNEGYIRVRHKECGQEFDRRAVEWCKNRNCFHCSSRRQVSYLHAIFVTEAKKLYPDCIPEYHAGFLGDCGKPSKYDLYIPNINNKRVLFEFQSRFHDDKKEFDKRKRQFALDNGYEFIEIDSRVVSPHDAVKTYLGVDIPLDDYAKRTIGYEMHFDYAYVQKRINEMATCKQIADEIGVSVHLIYNRMRAGLIKEAAERKQKIYGQYPVVQLSITGDLIKQYESQSNIYKTTGLKVGSCLQGKTKTCGGYVFISLDDYESNNYSLPTRYRYRGEDGKVTIKTIQEVA